MPEGVDAVLELVGCSVLADTLRTVRRPTSSPAFTQNATGAIAF